MRRCGAGLPSLAAPSSRTLGAVSRVSSYPGRGQATRRLLYRRTTRRGSWRRSCRPGWSRPPATGPPRPRTAQTALRCARHTAISARTRFLACVNLRTCARTCASLHNLRSSSTDENGNSCFVASHPSAVSRSQGVTRRREEARPRAFKLTRGLAAHAQATGGLVQLPRHGGLSPVHAPP